MKNLRVILVVTKSGIIAQSQVKRLGFWFSVSVSKPHMSLGDLFTDLGQMLISIFGESGSTLSRTERKRIGESCASALKKKLAT